MGQITTGLRSILSISSLYSLIQNILGARQARREVVTRYLQPRPGDLVLDVGCGPADILEFFPAVNYYGFDLSPAYIDMARKRFGDRGIFQNRNVGDLNPAELPEFDLIIMMSLLHHLEDEEARKLFATLKPKLKKHGRLVTIDPCRLNRQHRLARYLIDHDRGLNVRTPEDYRLLAQPFFPDLELVQRDDLLNLPYNHAILICKL